MDTSIFNSAINTSSPLITGTLDNDSEGVDLLFRIRMNGGVLNSFDVAGVKTQTIKDGLNSFYFQYQKDISLLSSVIYWQKRTIEYQATYAAFLLGSLSDDEFEKESINFTYHQKAIPPEHIASVVNRIDSLTGLKFDTSDYSSYFKCSQSNVMEGFKLLESNGYFSALLPLPANDVAPYLLDIK
jgi:hypothetical protein